VRRYIVCETVAAITLHLRELGLYEEPCYTGFRRPQPQTLCGMGVGWDTHIQLGQETCSACIEERKKRDE
jgi:hypothetical protein